MSINNILPHSIEVEQSILSLCLTGDVEEAIQILEPNDFYRTAHQKIFSIIRDFHFKKIAIELVSVTSALKDQGELENVGGAYYLGQLLDEIPLAVNIEHYADILKKKRALRELIKVSNEIISSCYQNNTDVNEILEDSQKAILSVNITDRNKSALQLKDLVIKAYDRYQSMDENKGKILGLPSGFIDFDRMTGGFQKTDLVILAARPSMGKSALATNIACNLAKSEHPCIIFSLEMSVSQITDRIISVESDINSMRFKVGGFSPEYYKKITEASSLVYDWPVFIDDTPGLSYMEIARRARKAKKAHEIEMVIIDYLQLVKGDQGQGKNYEIESITRGLKGLAKDLNVPVLLLSQLNRQCETRPHPYKRPQLSDLRDSGAIEQDADIVIFLYRPEHYDEKDKKGKDQPGIAEINIAKHRNGLTGGIKLMWKKEVMKFQNLEGSINGQP